MTLLCRWRRCNSERRAGGDFCRRHTDESFARLFPNHPKFGRLFPVKARVLIRLRRYIIRIIPPGGCHTIIADPPWRYEFSRSKSRKIENQYPTMSYEELCEVRAPAGRDAVLLMWATAPKLIEALSLMSVWGFQYKTHAVWDKVRVGMGYWFRSQHELLLVGTRGKPTLPAPAHRLPSIFREPRGPHSRKPALAHRAGELLPGPRLEMFAREKREGWMCWGNELGQQL